MANREGISSSDARVVLVTTNLEIHLATLVQKDESLSEFKEKFCKDYKKCCPQVGEINITAMKVKRRGVFFHLPDSMILSNLFISTSEFWFMYADLVRVDKAIMPADQNEKKKETTIDTDDLTSGEAQVAKKQSRKRKAKSSDAKGSRKKPAIESKGTKGIDSCEKMGISMGENQKSSDAGHEKTITVNSELVDGHTINNVQPNKTPQEALGTELTLGKSNESRESCGKVANENDLTGEMEKAVEKGEKTAETEQDKDLAPTLDGHTSSRDGANEKSHACEKVQAAEHCMILPREKLDDSLSGPIERDSKKGEESRLAPSAAEYTDKQLEASSTEKRRKRKKISNDHINQSMNEINGVDATPESGLVANPLAEAIQKENEKFSQDVGIETAKANSPATERKKRRKKSSKDRMKQSCGSIAFVDPGSNSFSNLVDTLAEAIENENENCEVGSKEATHITVEGKLETVNNLQAQESKTVDHIEVGKDIEAKSAKKSSKKKKSRKEAILVAAPIKVVVDGQGSDDVIRNVVDFLQEKKEDLEKSGKKSSKTLMKRSLNVEVVLALPANKPKASLKPNTERDTKEDHQKGKDDEWWSKI